MNIMIEKVQDQTRDQTHDRIHDRIHDQIHDQIHDRIHDQIHQEEMVIIINHVAIPSIVKKVHQRQVKTMRTPIHNGKTKLLICL